MLVFKERLQIKECIPFSMIIIGMMIIPIGNDLYQNDLSLGSLVTGDLLIIFSGLLYAVDITLCKYLGERFDVKKTVQIISFLNGFETHLSSKNSIVIFNHISVWDIIFRINSF